MTYYKKFITISDVAKQVGVSAGVVSFVLNGSSGNAKRYCSEELRKKIIKTASDLGYIQSNAASNLKGRPRKIIAVLIPQFYNDFFTEMVLTLQSELEKNGYMLLVCNTFDDPQREALIVRRMLEQRVDGFFIAPAPKSEDMTLSLIKMGVPLVVIDRYFDSSNEGYNSVLTQNYESSRMALAELIKAGHRTLAFIDWERGFGGLELRRKAFEDLVEEKLLNGDDIVFSSGELSEQQGVELTKAALARNRHIDAFVYSNQVYARLGIKYLIENKLIPGKNASVVIVGAPKWATSCLNNFTCVDLNGEGIGKKAAEIMAILLRGGMSENKYFSVSVPCSMHQGTSVVNKN